MGSISDVRDHSTLIILCLVGILLSTPQNILGPSLSIIAEEFGFEEVDKDLYIGSYMTLCFSVASLPISLLIGVYADFTNRKKLMSIVILAAGLSCISFGLSTNYTLLLLFRTISGSCLGGVIPVIFSIVSDFYSASDRTQVAGALTVAIGNVL